MSENEPQAPIEQSGEPTTGRAGREVIGSLQLGETHSTGKPVVELFSTDTRLKYPVLRLFDLSALVDVGIDPDSLEPGTRVHRRFFAHYTETDKTNKDGRNYRDVDYLEPIANGTDGPQANAADLGELLGELRAIRGLLEILVRQATGDGLAIESPPIIETAPPDVLEAAFLAADEPATPQEPSALDDFFPRPTPAPQAVEIAPASAEALAAHNPNGDNAPCGAEAMAAHFDTCQGIGHLLYGIRKIAGDGWEWPITDDQDGWNEAASYWREYEKTM